MVKWVCISQVMELDVGKYSISKLPHLISIGFLGVHKILILSPYKQKLLVIIIKKKIKKERYFHNFQVWLHIAFCK